ncbi:EAL domain-containing protein [Ruminococcus sp.]|uniref:EAL domain-containing protein n=1 Tax=Ruminococcus sp. TaxID=41978 RepID=UPI0025CBCDBD|nr:EAL domain-containing protein [Ruminococcus sp.]MBQ9543397.1 GGDEF and EAL domain-containing protein [Ruminococcus sp.]
MDDNYKLKAGLCIFDMNDGGRIISVDDDLFRFTGYSQDYVRENELTVFSLFDRAYREDTETILNDAAKEGRVFCIRQPMNCRDGSSLFVHCCGYVRDCSRVEMVISDCRCHDSLDGAQKKLMRQITEQQEKLHMIAENTDDVYYQYDVKHDLMHLTVSITRFRLDYDNCLENFLGRRAAEEFMHPDDVKAYFDEWEKALKKPTKGTMEFRTKAYDDDYCWYSDAYISFADENGEVTEVFGRLANIQKLKTLTSQADSDSEYIKYLLQSDQLTGLYNRKGFTQQAGNLLSRREEGYIYALVYSDINDFSYVNENFGYETGNTMLRDFAECLKAGSTYVMGCRIYSDFFITLCRAKSRAELIKSVEVENTSFTALQKLKFPSGDIRISCGMYILPDGEVELNTAIDNANLARRSVKHSSSILCGIYSQRMRMQKLYEQSICNELHAALENRQIEMFLQPKFHLEKRVIIGAEALARWRNPNGTYKMPFEFIPVLEKVGYIDELDFFIYEEVLRTLEKWKRDDRVLLPISVNFSQHHITQPKFVENLIDTANRFDVDKSFVEIEITESCFSGDTQALFSVMERLRSEGFKVSIDDFGIGYSTLSVLMNAPVDIVKIDKSFIDNIERNKNDRDFVANMCSLIDTANKDIIFEGVETDAQAAILCQSGYTKAQGWLFDKAMPLSDFEGKYMYNSDNK